MYRSSHLEALIALCETGSFDSAASMLRITQSAVSQRISALERQTGMVLVERSRPVAPTRPGRILLGLAQQIALLNADAENLLKAADLVPEGSGMVRVSLAINADSISTWFQPVIAQVANERSVLLDLHVEDQDHTETLLREGSVMAAVTTSSTAPPGCSVEPLGTMVYWPACAPSLLDGRPEVERSPSYLPMLRFDVKDDLQHAYLRQIDSKSEPPIHYIPSNREFLTAARLGLGWGVLPEGQITNDLTEGRLVLLDPHQEVQVPLYWQRWRIESPTLQQLSNIVHAAAANALTLTPEGL